jgi:fatty-acyl-CoA synthase
MTPVDDLAFQAIRQPNALAAVDLASARRWTYLELDQAVGRCAALFRGRYGLEIGDRVASLAKNRVELVIAALACARAGLIYVPLNWRLSRPEIEALLADADAGLLIGDEEMSRAGLQGVALDVLEDEIAACAEMFAAEPDPERISLILFTSGTSGKPKGVMLSERAHRQTALNFSLLGQVAADSVILVDTPMFHIIGLITSIRPFIMQGATILVSDGFDPARTLDRLGDPDLGVTHYFCVPQMADRIRAEPGFRGEALSNLTALFTGGAPHPAAAIRAWLDAGVRVADGFGMSEAGTVFGMALQPDIILAKAGSAGLPTPSIEARIVSADGNDVGPGEAGELLLRGANLFSGYWRQPEATAAAFSADGWFCTGDIAIRDDDGFFSIVDRKKDMFISGGENVYPAEIEAALASFPGLREAAVIGVADDRWGEVGLCAMVPADPSGDLSGAVREHLASRLASYKLPRHYVVLDRLPRTGSGKVLKTDLRALTLSLLQQA